jgi:branched-chain amino acid transport system ATP-binding protein
MTLALLHAKDIQSFYDQSQVIFDIELLINPGETIGLLGRNGMGKTTLIKSLLGLKSIQAGEIRFNGQKINGLSPDKIARLGLAIVPEGRQVFPNLTVLEHMTAFTAKRNDAQIQWEAQSVFELFPRLKERQNNLGSQLSGGEQQMLAIGRALVTNPKLLILDEATEGLAPLIREEIWSCLKLLRQRGQSLIIVDKYVNRLVEIADRHVILERGQVAWTGSSQELSNDTSLWSRYLGV